MPELAVLPVVSGWLRFRVMGLRFSMNAWGSEGAGTSHLPGMSCRAVIPR